MVVHSILVTLGGHRLTLAWLLLVATVSIHVYDEARHGFLAIYNPTVLRIREHFPFLRFPTFTYRRWLMGLIAAIAIALLLTPLSVHQPALFQPIAAIAAVAMILNGVSHLAGTIAGHTFSDIPVLRPMAGTYSSPAMIAAAAYVLIVLESTR
jgi:hypothetical protein